MTRKTNKIAHDTRWSAQNVLSYNAMFNFVVGARGVGKTYDSKVRTIKHFLKTGKRAIYLRRYDSELKDAMPKFFADITNRFPDYEFEVVGYTGYVRKIDPERVEKSKKRTRSKSEQMLINGWEPCIYFVPLSTTVSKKSVPYPDVDMIVYDEFIITNRGRAVHYLPDEVTTFIDFYNTVDRYADRVRVLFLANAVALVNPYFVYFQLKPRKEKPFTVSRDGYHCVEIVSAEAYKAEVDKSRFAQMIADTPYYDYAVNNEFADQSGHLVETKSSEAKFFYGLRFDNQVFAVWVDYLKGIYYISSRVPKNMGHGQIYALTRDDKLPNMLMLERIDPVLKGLIKMYRLNLVRFESDQMREQFSFILDYLGVK